MTANDTDKEAVKDTGEPFVTVIIIIINEQK